MAEDKVTVNLEGRDVEITVVDVITHPITDQDIMIYTIDSLEEDNIYASLVIEKDDEISLEAIEDEETQAFVDENLERLVAEESQTE